MPPVAMRIAFAFAVMLASAMPAAAQTAPDRYGARTTPYGTTPAALRVAAYQGPMLNWANKRLPGPDDAPVAAPLRAPTQAAVAKLRGAPAPQPQPSAYRPPAPLAMAAPAPRVEHLPASLYDPPSAPPVVAAPAPTPRKLAAATDTAPRVGGQVHLYSVHRAYGLTPDAIPPVEAGQGYVLIGPSDVPRAKAEDSDDDRPF